MKPLQFSLELRENDRGKRVRRGGEKKKPNFSFPRKKEGESETVSGRKACRTKKSDEWTVDVRGRIHKRVGFLSCLMGKREKIKKVPPISRKDRLRGWQGEKVTSQLSRGWGSGKQPAAEKEGKETEKIKSSCFHFISGEGGVKVIRVENK